jgi:isopenicillin-N epimerase
MKNLFFLDPEVIFLNHGSFGATPKPVMDAYQSWQARLERQPVKFIARELFSELEAARERLGDYLTAPSNDLVFIPNATFGVNIVARSLDLNPGDEILTTNHEYGACENVWEFIQMKTGAKLMRASIPDPVPAPEEVANLIWNAVTPRTRAIFISHISSPTAVQLPVDLICRRARQAGILTIIDGAHAPGQLPLNLNTIDPDFYLGNCHKWMLSPKGAGFLYARADVQSMLEPLVISWGWGENSPYRTGSSFIDQLEWWGTKDPAAYLSVPASIDFQVEHNWPERLSQCQRILMNGIEEISQITGLPSFYSENSLPFVQMAVTRLPAIPNLAAFQKALYQRCRIEVPCTTWESQSLIRISVQVYNTQDDLKALAKALAKLLPEFTR